MKKKIDRVHLEIHFHIIMDLHSEPLYMFPWLRKVPKNIMAWSLFTKSYVGSRIPMSQVSSIYRSSSQLSFSGPLWYPSASFYLMLTHIMQRSKYDALQFMLQGAAAV